MTRKTADNPMRPENEPERLLTAPRCGARTRSGEPCRAPAVRGRRRCRMHGGAEGSGAPKGERNGNYKHGHFTREAVELRRQIRALVAQMMASMEEEPRP
jgi:glucans biosynthesis protein